MLKYATIALAAMLLIGDAVFAADSAPAIEPSNDTPIACHWGGGWGNRGGGWGRGRQGGNGHYRGGCGYWYGE